MAKIVRFVPQRAPLSQLKKTWRPRLLAETLEGLEGEGRVRWARRPSDDDGADADPDMPNDITRIPGEELGMLHGQFAALGAWLEDQLARAEVQQAITEAYFEHVKAAIRLGVSGTVPDKTAKTANDPDVLAGELEVLKAQARYRLLRARLRGYEKCATALSREMTRRTPRTAE